MKKNRQKAEFIGFRKSARFIFGEIVAEQSAIDTYMLEKMIEKTRIIGEIKAHIIRKDNEVIIPARQSDSGLLEQFLLNAY